jgi:hypothetical protein
VVKRGLGYRLTIETITGVLDVRPLLTREPVDDTLA